MKSDAWASFRSAGELPDRDEWEPYGRRDPGPTVFNVSWMAPRPGSGSPVVVFHSRDFSGASHGTLQLAYAAALRWRKAMADRHGKGSVHISRH